MKLLRTAWPLAIALGLHAASLAACTTFVLDDVAIELMWLDEMGCPPADGRPALGVLAWIKYQIDRSRSVAEVLASDTRVRISGAAPIHYLVADPSGAAATLEFLDGRLVAHSGPALPVKA